MRCTCGHDNADTAARCAQCGRRLRDRNKLLQWLLDAAVGLGLLAALAVVMAVDRGPASDGGAADPSHGRARLAVTPREFDDVGRLLSEFGEGYQWSPIRMDDLLDPERLAKYEVVFLTCGSTPSAWLEEESQPGLSRGKTRHAMKPAIRRELHDCLRKYVADGGTLYASDWRFKLLAVAFPEVIDRGLTIAAEDKAIEQTVRAEVIDPGLQRRLGKELELNFDQAFWLPAAFKESEVTTILRGSFSTCKEDRRTAPLLVKFPFGRGTVIFTSFHNEAQSSDMETELLHYLVFASVMARQESDVRRTMVEGGFSPMEGNLLSASAGDQSIAETYRAEQPGDLQFVLAFEDRGARLKLAVTGPDGRQWEETGDSTLSIDVPDAPAGDWQYTIIPLEIPYRNFPFSLTIGRKGAHRDQGSGDRDQESGRERR